MDNGDEKVKCGGRGDVEENGRKKRKIKGESKS